MISDDPEFIDDETAKYRSGLKGNILAKIKNENDLGTCNRLLKTPDIFDPISTFLDRMSF